jgi:hypothetical protein
LRTGSIRSWIRTEATIDPLVDRLPARVGGHWGFRGFWLARAPSLEASGRDCEAVRMDGEAMRMDSEAMHMDSEEMHMDSEAMRTDSNPARAASHQATTDAGEQNMACATTDAPMPTRGPALYLASM